MTHKMTKKILLTKVHITRGATAAARRKGSFGYDGQPMNPTQRAIFALRHGPRNSRYLRQSVHVEYEGKTLCEVMSEVFGYEDSTWRRGIKGTRIGAPICREEEE